MEKEKIAVNKKRKTEICFVTGFFIKPFKIMINFFFYFSSSFAAQFSLFDIRDIKSENWELEIARNGKLNIDIKNNFNVL